MRFPIIAIVTVLLLVAIVVAVGWMLPVKHRASRSLTVAAPPDVVWKLMTDVDAFPSWRPDVKSVTRLPDRDGHAVWVEDGSNGRLTMAVVRSEAPRVMVTRIADPSLPFGGTWTYTLEPAASGSTLTIAEDGEIYNPLFRFMARFVFGDEASLRAYLSAVEAKLAKR